MNVKENNGCLFNVILILHKRRFNFIGVKYLMLNRVHIENLSSQAYAHVFSANFALDCVILITNKTIDKKSSHNPYTQDYARLFV